MVPRETNWSQWRLFSEYRSLSSGWHYPSLDFTSSIMGCPGLGLRSLVGNHLSQKSSTWSHANSKRGYQGLDFPICIKEKRSGTQSKPAITPKVLSILQREMVPRSDSKVLQWSESKSFIGSRRSDETSLEVIIWDQALHLESSENLINDSVVLLNIYMRRWDPASFLSWRQNALCQIWIIL